MRVVVELEVGESNASHLEELIWDDIQLALKSYCYEVISLEVQPAGTAVEQIFDGKRLLPEHIEP